MSNTLLPSKSSRATSVLHNGFYITLREAPREVRAEVRRVRRLLRDLGEQRGRVSRALRRGGHRGNISCYRCPIAQYLLDNEVEDAHVWSRVTTFAVQSNTRARYWIEIANPAPVREFVRGFDRGQLARDLFAPDSPLDTPPWERAW